MKKEKSDIKLIQRQICSINNVLDSTHDIIELVGETLLPSESGGGLIYDSRIESIIQELYLIIVEKNKTIKDRDNTIKELQNQLLKNEGEKNFFSSQSQ